MIVGFHGRLGSGKDTSSERLARIVDLPSYSISFAYKLKSSAAALINVERQWLENNKNNPNALLLVVEGFAPTGAIVDGRELEAPRIIRSFTIREYLQRYGTESHRDVFGDSFWIDQAFCDLGDISFESSLVCVTDVRFENEAFGVWERNGVLIEVKGKNDPDMYWDEDDGLWRESKSGLAIHPSEWPLYCDYVIDNSERDDQFASLDAQLYDIVKDLGLPIKRTE